jgi:peptide/nickel transport system ATP-binding protein
MYAGTICEQGLTDAVLAPPYHPYTEMLLAAIPSSDPGIARRARARTRADTAPFDKPMKGCCFQHRCPRKIGAICEDLTPPAVVAAPGHTIACHLPLAVLKDVPSVLPIDSIATESAH